MAQGLVEKGNIQNIANAIRSKLNSQNTFTVANMANNILNIPTSGTDYTGTITPAEYNIAFDTTEIILNRNKNVAWNNYVIKYDNIPQGGAE